MKEEAEVSLKETALKLADELDNAEDNWFKPYADMIRKLVAELDKQGEKIKELQVTKFHLEGDVNRLEDQVNELLVKEYMNERR